MSQMSISNLKKSLIMMYLSLLNIFLINNNKVRILNMRMKRNCGGPTN